MESIYIGKEVRVSIEDKVGALAEVTDYISGACVNIENICVNVIAGEAVFYFVTDNNTKVKSALESIGYKTGERQVVVLSLENRPGALLKVARKLKEENIDIKYLYGTTSGSGQKTTIVFSSDNNEKAVEVLKFILSLSDWAK
ncbi:MAG TPA: hypothetical protein PKN36_07545 [bacterium]|nr:hypothetical protein [bacterium]